MIKSFLSYVQNENMIRESLNKHSIHIEENFIINGKQGLLNSIEGLKYIIDTIGEGKPTGSAVSTKIDGAPAVFFGYDINNKFFVATKSLFNKNPKINYTDTDIDTNHPGELGNVLKIALKYLSKITPNNGSVYQGDMLFTTDTLQKSKINGINCLSWHPNTIVYTIQEDSDLGKQVSKAKMGIAVHTRYEWDRENVSTLHTVEFGISKNIFKSSSQVFLIDTISNLSSGKMAFDSKEMSTLTSGLKAMDTYANKIKFSILDESITKLLLHFINLYIRNNQKMPNAKQRVQEFVGYITDLMTKDAFKKKTEKGKQASYEKYQYFIDIVNANSQTFLYVFELFDVITDIKLIILNQLNKLSLYSNFVLTSSGDYIPTKDEGFVCVQTSTKGCKLVDRYEFSRNNFSKDIIAGFEKS